MRDEAGMTDVNQILKDLVALARMGLSLKVAVCKEGVIARMGFWFLGFFFFLPLLSPPLSPDLLCNPLA